jgi:Bacterial SCP ortholog
MDVRELGEALGAVGEWLDGGGPRPARDVLARAVRVSLRALAQIAPGAAVEVRVPPFAAVQCGAGPRHTRGTPSNVIETDPQTWLALATGRFSWPAALATGRLDASGTRADLSPWLPLVRPPHPAGQKRL